MAVKEEGGGHWFSRFLAGLGPPRPRPTDGMPPQTDGRTEEEEEEEGTVTLSLFLLFFTPLPPLSPTPRKKKKGQRILFYFFFLRFEWNSTTSLLFLVQRFGPIFVSRSR